MKLQAIQGFKDILPDEAKLWQRIEYLAKDIFNRFGFNEIRLPIMEETELFARSIGQSTDIVEKEMYTFTDKGITLRPEATASLLRAFVEHSLHVQQPVHRLYTIGPMFRHERPQKGRLRQFHQLDAEIIGAEEPEIDAELMAMGNMLLAELGIEASLELNSLGCKACRPAFREQLLAYCHQVAGGLCNDCRRRTTVNPLRVLDCKNPQCRGLVEEAPSILETLCSSCSDHFAGVRDSLDRLQVPYTVNRFMVRGLDYYTRTTFEFIGANLGSQSAAGAGGRYDGLIEELGGPALSGIGFAMGIERLVLLLQQQESVSAKEADGADIFIAALGEKAIRHCQSLVHILRRNSLKASMDYSGRSLKAQMKLAGRLNAKFVFIIGDKELEEKKAVFRDMRTKKQEEISLCTGPEEDALNLINKYLPIHERPNFKGIPI